MKLLDEFVSGSHEIAASASDQAWLTAFQLISRVLRNKSENIYSSFVHSSFKRFWNEFCQINEIKLDMMALNDHFDGLFLQLMFGKDSVSPNEKFQSNQLKIALGDKDYCFSYYIPNAIANQVNIPNLNIFQKLRTVKIRNVQVDDGVPKYWSFSFVSLLHVLQQASVEQIKVTGIRSTADRYRRDNVDKLDLISALSAEKLRLLQASNYGKSLPWHNTSWLESMWIRSSVSLQREYKKQGYCIEFDDQYADDMGDNQHCISITRM